MSAEFFSLIGRGVGAILLYAVLGVLLMLLGFFAVDLTTPGKLYRMVQRGLPNWRFAPAEVNGRRVKQLVEMPFQFAMGPKP